MCGAEWESSDSAFDFSSYAMSNYPPTPSFGATFNYNAHLTHPANGSHNMIHQTSFPQQRDIMFPSQAPPSQYPGQYDNAYAFKTNNQHINTSVPGGVIPPPPLFSGHGPYSNGRLPPPPYPPVPIPNYGTLLQRQIMADKQVPSPSTLQPHTSLPPRPPTQAAAAIDKEMGSIATSIPTDGDMEDGELSEGEKSRGVYHPSTSTRQSPQITRPRSEENVVQHNHQSMSNFLYKCH